MLFFWLVFTYLLGAIPWSVWLSKRFFSADPRDQPDRNPGAANAFRVGGWRLGVVVLLLDFAKAFLPVAACRLVGFSGDQLFWLSLMPTLGHSFSIFLRFHGGRGIVAMFGVWAALTLYQASLVMGLTAIVATLFTKNDEARSLSIPLALIAYLLVASYPAWMIVLAAAQLAVLAAKIGAFVFQRQTHKRIGAV
ncbi:MAG TPA: glycerol-3-phosphate acyltransferase [Ktedonobacterales bacterium]|nr:glycerol-3-phosphate acyltransferase [Ktedonobacterales bacterium]